MLKVVTVCGLGVGSSLIMKLSVQDVLKNMDIAATVEHWDMGTLKGKEADIIVTTQDFKKHFVGQDNVIFIKNIVNKKEIQEKLEEYFKK